MMKRRPGKRNRFRAIVGGMDPAAFTLFDTALGRSAIVWGDNGIVRTLLPERAEAKTLGLVERLFPGVGMAEPDGAIARTVAAMQSLLAGGSDDLRDAPLDMAGVEPFPARVYQALRLVGPGETITYGALAERIGASGEARAVGATLARNPFPVIVPCHRVLAAGGRAGGFSAPGGVATKLAMLTRERARTSEAAGLFDGMELPLATKRG